MTEEHEILGKEPEVLEEETEAEVEAEAEQPDEPVGFEDDVVTLGGREFTIEEPTVEITLRILNVIGKLGLRGERLAATQVVKNPTSRAALFGMLAAMTVSDLVRFGSAVLQFEDDKEGQKWMK
jgi:hypothetical protein